MKNDEECLLYNSKCIFHLTIDSQSSFFPQSKKHTDHTVCVDMDVNECVCSPVID